MAISGTIATIATIPKPFCKTDASPPMATQAPTERGKIKLEVKGPDATPPLSKAIAV